MTLIELSKIEKTYSEGEMVTPVLKDLSLSIEAGEFAAIMGPSGSGKSTLLHILGFLDQPSSGTYRFEGKLLSDYTDDELAHVRNEKLGFVFQAFNLLPRTTVLHNVMLPLTYSAVREEEWEKRATAAVDAVGLTERLQHEPSQLSGGEKQRVAIARALVNNPQIIFADEPTGNLDSRSGAVVMDLIQKLHVERGHTVILITHETYTAEYAERIIRIRDGRIESDLRVENRRTAGAFIK